MHDVPCEVYENGEMVYNGNIPTTKLKFGTKGITPDMNYTFTVPNAEKVIIEALETDVTGARMGSFEFGGPVRVAFKKGTLSDKRDYYEASVDELVDKDELTKKLKEEFMKSANLDYSVSSYSSGTKNYNLRKRKDRMKLGFDNILSKMTGKGSIVDGDFKDSMKEMEEQLYSLGDKLTKMMTGYSGKVYFNSEKDFKSAKKKLKKGKFKGLTDFGELAFGYEISWFMGDSIKYSVRCE